MRPKMKPIRAENLERWLGKELVEKVSRDMRGWYGPPIALAGVPGAVYVAGDGDFYGRIHCGGVLSAWERGLDIAKRVKRCTAPSVRRRFREQAFATAGTFNSLSALIQAATSGKKYRWLFQKSGPTGVANVSSSLWRLGTQPAAGTTPSAAPGGNAPDDTTTGAFAFANPASAEQYITSAYPQASQANNTLLLYDRIFHVAKTMNSTATEAVTGVPTRYQSTTATDQDYAGGNFLFVEVGGTALAATAHNWTVCQYTDQDGNTGVNLPSLTGNSGAIVDRFDHPVGQWFAPLASGDIGIKALTQMQCSAAVATGAINFVMGHPIAMMPCPVAIIVCVADYVNTAFDMERIFNDACLAFLEMPKPTTTATNYSGYFTSVAV